MEQHAWHALDIDEIFAALETSASGLKSEQAATRLAQYGPNEIG